MRIMTCREFKHDAAALTLWELSRTEDNSVLEHSEHCESCSAWLRKQRTLAMSMQTLQARTAGLEAGPDVERALLHAFRQGTLRSADRVLGGVQERSGLQYPAVTPLSTPVALRMSRFFEVGSYVALAAALLVGIFLGLRLLRDSNAVVAQSAGVQHTARPVTQPPKVVTNHIDAAAAARAVQELPARRRVRASHAQADQEIARTTNDDSRSLADAGYTELMLCDPLSCSADTQVVRVELPAASGQASQPQMADVVVGYDGVVRAVRIVN